MNEQEQAQYDALVDDAERRDMHADNLYRDGHKDEAGRMYRSADVCRRMASELAFPAFQRMATA